MLGTFRELVSKELALFLEVYLFCCSKFDCGTSKLRGNMRIDKKKGIHYGSKFLFSHMFWNRTRVCNLLFAFLESLETCSLFIVD